MGKIVIFIRNIKIPLALQPEALVNTSGRVLFSSPGFGCSKVLSHWDGSFEYQQNRFWLINKNIKIVVHTLNSSADWKHFLRCSLKVDLLPICTYNIWACTRELGTYCIKTQTSPCTYAVSQVLSLLHVQSMEISYDSKPGDKNSTPNYEWNLARMSNSTQSTGPVGQVLRKELLEEVILLPYVLNCIHF